MKPSFDAPAEVTSGGESGWVFRSDAPDAAAEVEPAPPAIPDVAPPARLIAAPVQPAAAAAEASEAGDEPAPQAIVMAPVVASESPLRFAWVPLAIGYTTILAMLPRPRNRKGAER